MNDYESDGYDPDEEDWSGDDAADETAMYYLRGPIRGRLVSCSVYDFDCKGELVGARHYGPDGRLRRRGRWPAALRGIGRIASAARRGAGKAIRAVSHVFGL